MKYTAINANTIASTQLNIVYNVLLVSLYLFQNVHGIILVMNMSKIIGYKNNHQ